MRLIDADAYIAKLEHVPMVQEAIRKSMDTMPTIEVRKKGPWYDPERKKGQWYDVGSLSCRCSECGCKSPKEYSFCPNCGADMRGEENGN